MASGVNLIAFGTFGNPNGFKQTFFVGDKDLAKSVKTFDLNTNAIKLFVSSKIYAVRKEYANGFKTIAYSVYTYAREQNSDRSGTFIGSSILYANKIAKEQVTITQLNEFHNQLVTKNVSNDIISVNHSDKFSVVKPKDFDKIEFHLREIENLDFKQNTDNFLVVFCNINDNSLNQHFEKAIGLLNVYDTIYFTDSQEVAEFVYQKGIFKLIQNVGEKRDFEREIDKLIEERKRKREQSISEFERDIQRITDDKKSALQGFRSQIEQGERIHFENERKLKESKEDANKIEQFYDDFINKTKILIDQFTHSKEEFEEVKQIHNRNKVLFNNGLIEFKKPNYITSIAKPKPKGNLKTEQSIKKNENENEHEINEKTKNKVYKINKYKATTIVLTFLLLSTWAYLFFFKSNSDIKIEKPISSNKNQTGKVATGEGILDPVPNSNLNENDYRYVAKHITYNSKIEDVVKKIFELNDDDVRSHYLGQEKIYANYLFIANIKCFKKDKGIIYFSNDTLKRIPSFDDSIK